MDQKFARPTYPNQMVYKAYYYPYDDKPYFVSTYYSEVQPTQKTLQTKHINRYTFDIKYFILIILILFLLYLF